MVRRRIDRRTDRRRPRVRKAQRAGVVYVLVCTAPTGHLAAAWLLDRPGRCDRDDSRFGPYRPALWALIEHLIGTFWILDLYGWQDRPAPA